MFRARSDAKPHPLLPIALLQLKPAAFTAVNGKWLLQVIPIPQAVR
jgi:hypothetical protein